MNQNVTILSVTPYEITNDKGVIENSGCTVRYIMSEDLNNVEDKTTPSKGHKPAKATVPYNDYDKFTVVPGLYEATLSAKIASDGKVSLTATEFKFISGLTVTRSTSTVKA